MFYTDAMMQEISTVTESIQIDYENIMQMFGRSIMNRIRRVYTRKEGIPKAQYLAQEKNFTIFSSDPAYLEVMLELLVARCKELEYLEKQREELMNTNLYALKLPGLRMSKDAANAREHPKAVWSQLEKSVRFSTQLDSSDTQNSTNRPIDQVVKSNEKAIHNYMKPTKSSEMRGIQDQNNSVEQYNQMTQNQSNAESKRSGILKQSMMKQEQKSSNLDTSVYRKPQSQTTTIVNQSTIPSVTKSLQLEKAQQEIERLKKELEQAKQQKKRQSSDKELNTSSSKHNSSIVSFASNSGNKTMKGRSGSVRSQNREKFEENTKRKEQSASEKQSIIDKNILSHTEEDLKPVTAKVSRKSELFDNLSSEFSDNVPEDTVVYSDSQLESTFNTTAASVSEISADIMRKWNKISKVDQDTLKKQKLEKKRSEENLKNLEDLAVVHHNYSLVSKAFSTLREYHKQIRKKKIARAKKLDEQKTMKARSHYLDTLISKVFRNWAEVARLRSQLRKAVRILRKVQKEVLVVRAFTALKLHSSRQHSSDKRERKRDGLQAPDPVQKKDKGEHLNQIDRAKVLQLMKDRKKRQSNTEEFYKDYKQEQTKEVTRKRPGSARSRTKIKSDSTAQVDSTKDKRPKSATTRRNTEEPTSRKRNLVVISARKVTDKDTQSAEFIDTLKKNIREQKAWLKRFKQEEEKKKR
jgi:hypothetical protein